MSWRPGTCPAQSVEGFARGLASFLLFCDQFWTNGSVVPRFILFTVLANRRDDTSAKMSAQFFMQPKFRTRKSNLRWKTQRWEVAGYISVRITSVVLAELMLQV